MPRLIFKVVNPKKVDEIKGKLVSIVNILKRPARTIEITFEIDKNFFANRKDEATLLLLLYNWPDRQTSEWRKNLKRRLQDIIGKVSVTLVFVKEKNWLEKHMVEKIYNEKTKPPKH